MLYMPACICMHAQLQLYMIQNNFNLYCYRLDWIEWQGNRFCLAEFVWYDYQDELPKFGKIDDIISVDQQVFLCLNVHVTKGIDRHHHSFVVKSTDNNILYPLAYLNKLTGWMHSLQSHTFISSPETIHIVTKCFVNKIA